MRRLRRAHQRHARTNMLFKRRVLAVGTAAAISLTAAARPAKSLPLAAGDKHQVPVAHDADRDLLTDREELAMGYLPFRGDQNQNTVADGAELAVRCADAIAQLPTEAQAADSGQTYKRELVQFGIEQCDICGEPVNMGPIWVVNPHLNLEIQFTFLGLHYLQHGSFSYAGELRKGRLDVARLLRVLEVRYPDRPDDHQLPLDDPAGSGDPVDPDTTDQDGDWLADSEELAIASNLHDADQNDNLVPDGIDLARRCAEIIDRLPTLDPDSPDAKGLYKESFMMRGLEWCEICGESVNMGFWRIRNSASGMALDVYEIVRHHMEHGSFSYRGSLSGAGRADVAALAKILELPARCGDVGTVYPPGDLNADCKVDFGDVAELAERWLNSTDPAG